MAKAPSTVASPPEGVDNPLARSLERITGEQSPLSTSTGTQGLIGYENFTPVGNDIINVSSSPGTGATTAETWSHEIALENLRRQQMQFEFEQSQAILTNALREQEAARAAAAEARAAGLYDEQTKAAQLANQSAQAELLAKERANEFQLAGMQAGQNLYKQQAFLGGAPISTDSQAAYAMAQANPSYRPAQFDLYGRQIAPSNATYIPPQGTRFGDVGQVVYTSPQGYKTVQPLPWSP